jgi:heme exporter protein B
MFTRQVLAILTKDLKVEWRTREIFTSMVVFAMLVVVVFNFAIGANPELIQQVAPGVLWVALLFATVLGLQRAVQMENEEDCLQGMLLTMNDRSALFVAKTVANMLYLFLVATCTLPLFGIWLHIDIMSHVIPLSLILLLGMLGFSALGTLFSIIALNTRAQAVLLPLLFLPVSVPLIIASVYATSKIVAGGGLAEITDYLTLMAVFDIVFFVLSSMVFDYIIEE